MNALAVSEPLIRGNWINALADTGWAVTHALVSPELAVQLRREAIDLHENGYLSRAGVGRAEDHALLSSIRRDKTKWLSRESAVQAAYLDVMEEVRLAVNSSLFMGLFSYEAHFAAYEPGAFYKRHMDAFKGARNRVLSSVFYLNEDWLVEDGGALAIYADETSTEIADLVVPELGTLVLFLSEDIPHEVLPANRDRYSIAGWFRVNDRGVAPSLQVALPTTPDLPDLN